MEELTDLLAVRRQKLDALQAAGVTPYGQRFDITGRPGEIR